MKNRIFVDLKSVKIAVLKSNLQVRLLLASLTQNAHLKFKKRVMKNRIFGDLKSVKI